MSILVRYDGLDMANSNRKRKIFEPDMASLKTKGIMIMKIFFLLNSYIIIERNRTSLQKYNNKIGKYS